jgi:hypothetical protein
MPGHQARPPKTEAPAVAAPPEEVEAGVKPEASARPGRGAGTDVHLISITTDAPYDTPERLRAWAQSFKQNHSTLILLINDPLNEWKWMDGASDPQVIQAALSQWPMAKPCSLTSMRCRAKTGSPRSLDPKLKLLSSGICLLWYGKLAGLYGRDNVKLANFEQGQGQSMVMTVRTALPQ